MGLSVEQLTSEVTVEPGPVGQQAPAPEKPWERLAEHRATRDRLGENELRVRAEAFDD